MDDALELKRKGPLTGEQDLYLQDVFGFHRFHSEICEFLAERGIDRPSFLPPENWVEFLKNYAEVIRDCPLVFKAGKKEKTQLKNIDRAVAIRLDVAEEHRPAEPWRYPYGIQWEFSLRDQVVYRMHLPILYREE
jgi:hypothetical protein